MDEDHQLNPERHEIEYYEDEIKLIDLLKVIWKWKYLIIAGAFICAIGAAVISLNMTKIYGITTVLQPGMLKVTADGKTVYIDSSQNIKALIETGGLNGQVLKYIQFPDQKDVPTYIEFKVTIPKKTKALEVLYETPYPDIGMQMMKNLNKGLLERYSRTIKLYQEDYENKIRQHTTQVFALNDKVAKAQHAILGAEAETVASIKQLNNKKSTLEAQIETKKNQIKNLGKRISEIEIEIDRISQNTDLLISERNKFLESKQTENNILSAVIYSNTIQQNIGYLNNLRSKMSNTQNLIYEEQLAVERLTNDIMDLAVRVENISEQTKLKNEDLASEILAIGGERDNVLVDIQSLKFKKSQIQNIQIIKSPKVSRFPIKPKTRLNVMLAGVVGLFLTVFLAFFVEYISKCKSRETDE